MKFGKNSALFKILRSFANFENRTIAFVANT